MKYFRKVFASSNSDGSDLAVAMDACDFYEDIHDTECSKELDPKGVIEQMSMKIPGIAENRYAQLQDLESILEYLEQRERKERINKTKDFMFHYDRSLTHTVAKDYAEASDEVQTIKLVIQRVANVRNIYLGWTKGIEYLHFQLGHVIKMRQAGIEDSVL